MTAILPATDTPFGERVARRLRDELIIWMTTTSADGTPQPNPVWFLWDGEGFLIYSKPDSARLPHIRRNARIALHFDGDGNGGDIIVFAGEAREAPEAPPANDVADYIAKYQHLIAEYHWTPASFAADYSVPIRVTVTKVRGH
jgi:PPOX class probable F420-dependent enzyme